MKLTVQWDFNKLMQLNDKVNAVSQIIMIDIGQEISNNAKENAPYLTWALRRSISNDFNTISKWFVVVGSPLSYASVREFSNRKHPDRKYYLERSFTQHVWDIMDIIMEDLDYKLKE